MFIDAHNRRINYLRLSVTDRCDFRCVYCMAEEMTFLPRKSLLSLEEMARIGKIFAENGTSKFRLTGGEPLIRKNIQWLIQELGQYDGVNQIAITTNGSHLQRVAKYLKTAGTTRLNISLDTLDKDNFHTITRTGQLATVLDGIKAAQDIGLKNIRLNAVIMRGNNDNQIIPLTEYARNHQLDLAFIEEMPLGEISHNREETFIASQEIRNIIHQHYPLAKSLFPEKDESGPADYWLFTDGNPSRIGFISPHSCNFCADCNRVRLTVEGRLLLCLGHENSIDLRDMLRSGKSESEITQTIQENLQKKPKTHEFNSSERPMIFCHR
ncbi:MAG: GTP 3',8-cyclase MoaA, partial [Ostreibacterium sp.]